MRIVAQVMWKFGDLQFTLMIEINQSTLTVQVVERSKTSHNHLMMELMRSQLTIITKHNQMWLIAGDDDSAVSRNVFYSK